MPKSIPEAIPNLEQLISEIEGRDFVWFLRRIHASEQIPGAYLGSVFAFGNQPILASADTPNRALWGAYMQAIGAFGALHVQVREPIGDIEAAIKSGPSDGQSIN